MRLQKLSLLLIVFIIGSLKINAQQPTFRDSLLGHLAGKWVAAGIIAKKHTTHNITATWVLNHQYLKIDEVSEEKDSTGAPYYQATVYVGWQQATNSYACVWLDDYGSVSPESIGIAKKDGTNSIAFIFSVDKTPVFHTTFKYNPSDNTWQWLMDNEDKGVLEPFARLTLRPAVN